MPDTKLTVFLIIDDNDSRRIFRNVLKTYGYKVSLAVDEEDGLDRVEGGHLKADLVLINLPFSSPEESLIIGRNICLKGNLIIPIVAVATKFGIELEGTNVQVNENEYISYAEDGEQLFDLISNLIQ